MIQAGKIRNYLITAVFIAAVFMALRPYIAYLLYRRSGDYMSGSMVKDAARSYRKTLFFDGRDVDSRNWLAYCYTMLGDRDKAIAEYRIAIKLDPDNVTAYFDLGMIYRDMGDLDSAKAMFIKGGGCKKSSYTTDSNYRFYVRSSRHVLETIEKQEKGPSR